MIFNEVKGTSVWKCPFATCCGLPACPPWGPGRGISDTELNHRFLHRSGNGDWRAWPPRRPALSTLYSNVFCVAELEQFKDGHTCNYLYMRRNKKFPFFAKSRTTKITPVTVGFPSPIWPAEVPLALFCQSAACHWQGQIFCSRVYLLYAGVSDDMSDYIVK